MPSKPVYLTDDQKTNRFINYYIIKWFWLRQKRPLRELYETFVNRTLYDNILSKKDKDIEKQIAKPSEKTGIGRDYYFGNSRFEVNGLSIKDWKDYISLRENGGNLSDKEIAEKQRRKTIIDNALTDLFNNKSSQNRIIETILYYIENRQKISRNACKDRIEKVSVLIKEFNRDELANVDSNTLKKYYTLLSMHGLRIKALLTLKDFK